MTKDDVIKMAREAGFRDADEKGIWITDGFWDDELGRFAALVAAAERETVKTYYEMSDEHINKVTQAAVVAEREACAKVCDGLIGTASGTARECAAAIRARGQE